MGSIHADHGYVLNDDDALNVLRKSISFVDDSVSNRGISFAIKSLMRFADLFSLAMSGHAGPILINFDVTALVNGRRACRADLTAGSGGNRASDGGRSHPKSRDSRCQSELRRGLD
jgi:hypothetical protein